MLPGGDDVARAREHIHGFAIRTPLLKLDADLPGTEIYLKLENLQPLGSFKIRAARNALQSMDPVRLRHGVLTASAGRHSRPLTGRPGCALAGCMPSGPLLIARSVFFTVST